MPKSLGILPQNVAAMHHLAGPRLDTLVLPFAIAFPRPLPTVTDRYTREKTFKPVISCVIFALFGRDFVICVIVISRVSGVIPVKPKGRLRTLGGIRGFCPCVTDCPRGEIKKM